ncbi:MAG: sensor histidine kinase [Butyrivibrio sp.]
MITFAMLPEAMSTTMLVMLFLATIYEFALIHLHRVSYSLRNWHIMSGCLMSIILFVMLFACVSEAVGVIPVVVMVAVLAVTTAHITAETLIFVRHRNDILSPYAIKEATDDLTSGICFADSMGRIVLCNRLMGELSSMLMGSYPQTSEELERALNMPGTGNVEIIPGEPALHRFNDGRVWHFFSTEMQNGFVQITAQDVTELHEANERLQKENEELREVNLKLRKMYERLAARIREQETLELKMRIHDNIGASLIAISEALGSDSDENPEEQLEILQEAVGYLADELPATDGTFEALRQKAASMKVSLSLDGVMPQNIRLQSLIVSAVRECVTNCVNHANGNRVRVEIADHFDIYTVTITNNGEVPRHRIVEGGGLSTLRKSIEASGGEMYISQSPEFALIINLPKKETDYD